MVCDEEMDGKRCVQILRDVPGVWCLGDYFMSPLNGQDPHGTRSEQQGDLKGLEWQAVVVNRTIERADKYNLPLEDVVRERFANMEEFEKTRQQVENAGFKICNVPTSSTILTKQRTRQSAGFQRPQERLKAAAVPAYYAPPPPKSSTPISNVAPEDLNKLNARLIKAELADDKMLAAELKSRINAISARVSLKEAKSITLLPSDTVKPTEDEDSIQSMMRHEKLAASNEMDADLASRISGTTRRDNSYDHYDELGDQMEKGDRQKRRNETIDSAIRKRRAIQGHMRNQAIMDKCWFCLDSDAAESWLVIAVAQFVYLAVPKFGAVEPSHCMIVPIQHCASTLECDENVWDEIRNFKKCLIRMAATATNRGIVFIENVAKINDPRRHTYIDCITIPAESLEDARIYFKKALLDCDVEWSQHKKVIETSEKGGLRRSIPKNFPYVYIDFRLDQGLAHVIEDADLVPSDFGRILAAKLLGAESNEWKFRETDTKDRDRIAKLYKDFDWTDALCE